MKKHSTNSKDDLAPTSKPGRRPIKSERDFLAYQLMIAQKALVVAARSIANDFGKVLDPRVWARRFPLQTTGVAAVAGFVAVTHEEKSRQETPPEPSTATQPSEKPETTLVSMLIAAGVDILKNALTPVLSDEIAETLHSRRSQKETT